jgi:hypothetical protein
LLFDAMVARENCFLIGFMVGDFPPLFASGQARFRGLFDASATLPCA